MLIRWVVDRDIPSWQLLATEVSHIFGRPGDMGSDSEFISYAKRKTGKHEALTAVDYMSGANMGFIGFSREQNSISWFAVSERYQNKGVGKRLLKTALRQLDTNKDITVITFCEDYPTGAAARKLYMNYGFLLEEAATYYGLPRSKMTRLASNERRGKSFHYRYPEFIRDSQKETCPVCNDKPAPDGQNDLQINDIVWIVAEYPGQGRLFGKMYVMPRCHVFHFEDMPDEDAAAFINEVQRVGRALRKVTGAEKINYEMHSNTGAHLHIHLCPRYLDDDYPGQAIDLSRPSDPPPYESYDEFLWFTEQMKKELE